MIPVARLLRRAGPGRRRAAAAIKAELREARRRGSSAEARALAARAGSLRDELAELVDCGAACGSCAVGFPHPEGAYAGGRCCAIPTSDVFQPVEIELLAARGIGPGELGSVPREPDAGCAFRGSAGCSLALRARPTICVHYICSELMAELATRGIGPRIGELREELEVVMKELAELVDEERTQMEFDEVFSRRRE